MSADVTRIGLSGHQSMSPETRILVADALRRAVPADQPITGLCSLAFGADQLFAEVILDMGHELEAILPSAHYEDTFETQTDRTAYRELLARASRVHQLEFSEPTEEAFFAAGKYVVERSQKLLAVWDGKPAAGLGGTADVVAYARERRVEVQVIWPPGALRA